MGCALSRQLLFLLTTKLSHFSHLPRFTALKGVTVIPVKLFGARTDTKTLASFSLGPNKSIDR